MLSGQRSFVTRRLSCVSGHTGRMAFLSKQLEEDRLKLQHTLGPRSPQGASLCVQQNQVIKHFLSYHFRLHVEREVSMFKSSSPKSLHGEN